MEEEVAVEEEDNDIGTRDDFLLLASTDRDSKSRRIPGLLAANNSDWTRDGEWRRRRTKRRIRIRRFSRRRIGRGGKGRQMRKEEE